MDDGWWKNDGCARWDRFSHMSAVATLYMTVCLWCWWIIFKQTKTILTLQYSVEIISSRETTLELEGETYIESLEHCKFCKRSLLLLNLDLCRMSKVVLNSSVAEHAQKTLDSCSNVHRIYWSQIPLKGAFFQNFWSLLPIKHMSLYFLKRGSIERAFAFVFVFFWIYIFWICIS